MKEHETTGVLSVSISSKPECLTSRDEESKTDIVFNNTEQVEISEKTVARQGEATGGILQKSRDALQTSPSIQERTETVFPFQEDDLCCVDSDQFFTKAMLPKVFWSKSTENVHRRYQARIDWTTKWLQRRKDRADAIIDTESKRFHDMPIIEKLNTLSNRQLHIWLKHQKDVLSQLGPLKENCQELKLSDLDKLPSNHHFTFFMFPEVLRSRDREHSGKRLQAKIDWATKWLERREDREDFQMTSSGSSTHLLDLPIHRALDVLSNCQLHLWLDLQKDTEANFEKAGKEIPLTKEALFSLDKDHEFTAGMFLSIPDNCRRRGRRRQCKFFWPV